MSKSKFRLKRNDDKIFEFESEIPSLEPIDVLNNEEQGYETIGKLFTNSKQLNNLVWFYQYGLDIQSSIQLLIVSYYHWVANSGVPENIASTFFKKSDKIEALSPLRTKENLLSLYRIIWYQMSVQFEDISNNQKED